MKAAEELYVQLEGELPQELTAGRATAVFVCGWCFHPGSSIASLSISADGVKRPVTAHGMPRLDPLAALHPRLERGALATTRSDPESADPLMHSYRSGFWATVALRGREPGRQTTLELHARLSDGGQATATLGRIAWKAPEAPLSVSWPGTGPRVAICMATYDPPLPLLERQLASIRDQTHDNWVCVISDDCSREEHYQVLRAATEGDPRFRLSRAPRRLGFYANFERALALAPADCEFVAMADQDDVWHPDKLEVLLAAIAGAPLVYSDARVVDASGQVLSETWWNVRANNHSDLLSLLVANAVTGAASLMRREVLDDALPFPPAQFAHFHDHWVGLVAAALGEIRYVPRPLYDYTQHGRASLGHAAANAIVPLGRRLRHPRPLAERIRMWRLHYFVDVCRLMQFAQVLELRCAERMTPAKRRALERFTSGERSVPAVLRLAARGLSELIGRPETLGAEWMLACAFLWRRLVAISARDRPQRRLRLDALPPPTLVQAPGRVRPPEPVARLADKIAPLALRIGEDEPPRVNLLVPTIDLRHFFGGYIAKFNLAAALARSGARVRVITTDPVGPLAPDWRRTLETYSGLSGLLDRIEIAFGREAASVPVSRDDGFIATTWWTAHIARAALELVAADRFVYLIQEYEPFTFPMGSYAALAEQSYRFPHFALFSSELLRDYFRRHAIGVFATGPEAGERSSDAFQNAITEVVPPDADVLAAREVRKLLFYARPEGHAARNMYELGVLGLMRALEEGAFGPAWRFHGIGTVGAHQRIALAPQAELELLPRSDQRAYARLLREHDIGLALMYTPHPSLVPIEMASAGMLTVTNSFDTKDAEALAEISSNLLVAEPAIESIAAALSRAADGVADGARRVRGAQVNWSREWAQSFQPALVKRLMGELQPALVPS